MLFTLGSDPEFMLVDQQGKYRSAIGIVYGTKDDKVSLGNGHYAFYDNVLVEVNVRSESNREAIINSFGDCFQRLAKLVGNFKVVPQASNTYDLAECQHPDAQKFGCDPEYCIYVRENGFVTRMEPPIVDPTNPFRTGGGHIHIGHEICFEKTIDVIQYLDLFIGITSLFVDHDPTSAARRQLYGGAGTFRIKEEYGLEYRSVSNFWLASPILVGLIYDLVDFTLEFVSSDKKLEFVPEEVRSIINSGNKELAKEILSRCENVMPNKLSNKIKELSASTHFDFYKEWALTNQG
jgi:hypothetical protein